MVAYQDFTLLPCWLDFSLPASIGDSHMLLVRVTTLPTVAWARPFKIMPVLMILAILVFLSSLSYVLSKFQSIHYFLEL